jgi:chemotaxis protein CheD
LIAVSEESLLISVLMGDVKTTSAPNRLRTILGSCVGIMLFDARRKMGSMGHIVLPASNGRATDQTLGKFADTALPLMLQQMKEGIKGERRIVAKIAGGASMFGVGSQTNNIGLLNKQAVETLLKAANIPIIACDLGGEKGRRVTFDLVTGEVTIEVQDRPMTKI